MQYRLHDADKELWSWVKARAYLADLTVNDYILAILKEVKHKDDLDKADANKYKTSTLRPLKP